MSFPLYIPNPVFPLISKEYYKGTDGHRLKQFLFSCHHHNVYGEKNPGTESVPLNKKTRTILERLQGCQRTRTLVPCNSCSRFSTVTRKLLTLAGITCDIPGHNTEEVQGNHETDQRNRGQPHNNTGGTGNLYRQVNDPELVASMSGHAEESHVFARYRTTDDGMKMEQVNLIYQYNNK